MRAWLPHKRPQRKGPNEELKRQPFEDICLLVLFSLVGHGGRDLPTIYNRNEPKVSSNVYSVNRCVRFAFHERIGWDSVSQ